VAYAAACPRPRRRRQGRVPDYERARCTRRSIADNKQYRELYGPAAALEAAKKGEPLPSGTVLTLVQYAAKLDAQGNPEKDANGRFIKTNILAYTVMEKRAGWGTEYPENVRKAIEYQAFKPTRHPTRGQPHRLLQFTSRSTSRTSSWPTTR
jgi:hypothetical protein